MIMIIQCSNKQFRLCTDLWSISSSSMIDNYTVSYTRLCDNVTDSLVITNGSVEVMLLIV